MRLHSNVINVSDIVLAVAEAKASLGCWIDAEISIVGSRSHARAFEVRLTGDGSQCRNRANAGTTGADGDYAAGYAAWGWMMAELYDVDPAAVWGSAKRPICASKADFHLKTADLFNTDLDLAERAAQTIAFQSNGPRKMAKRQADLGRRWDGIPITMGRVSVGSPGHPDYANV